MENSLKITYLMKNNEVVYIREMPKTSIIEEIHRLNKDRKVICICAENFDVNEIGAIKNKSKFKKEFVIVKYAARIYNKGTRYQPRIDGVVRDQSAHTTYTGKDAGLKEMYTSLVEAEKDLKRITELNISGYYAICFVK